MNKGMSFDWRQLGKADYAQTAALIASLPSDVRSQIKGVSDELLRRIVYLMWYRSEHSGRGSAYCFPSLAKLGTYVMRCVRTVQRHIESLVHAGLLCTKERYRADGINTSSLYTAGPRLLACLFARKARKSPMIRPTTKMSCNDLKREYKASAPIQKGERMTDFLAKHRAEQNQPLGAASFDSATDDWGQETYEQRRRRELKAQAKVLVAAETEGEW